MNNNIWGGVLFSILLRWSVSLHGYSGQGRPPMYGDYEAQRHWMELTVHIPMKDWYFETSQNDLNYWGLDYPPLTAYHSWISGKAADHINSSWVALNTSRGIESPQHKLFMRYTVLLSDLLTYIPAVISYSYLHPSKAFLPQIFVFLIYPGLILIDHGHFQYNCISLGLALFSYIALSTGHDLIASILFCLSLSYKQMLLYFALPFFFFFLGRCYQIKKSSSLTQAIKKFFFISGTVLLTFALIWGPLTFSTSHLIQIVHRIFPLARGIFEDKVSNFWCVVNIFFKFRNYLSNFQMALLSGALTLITTLPSCLHTFFFVSSSSFSYSLVNSSLAFFLFSYQVHEKTILIPALGAMLIFKTDPFHSFWFLLISIFSMFPLLYKDDLLIPFVGLSVFFILSINMLGPFKDVSSFINSKFFLRCIPFIYKLSFLIWIPLFVCSIFFNPPSKYPDIFPLLISCFSSIHFVYFCIYFNYVQMFKLNKRC